MNVGPKPHTDPQTAFEVYEDFTGALDNTIGARYKEWLCTVSVGTVNTTPPSTAGRYGIAVLTGGVLATQFACLSMGVSLMNGVPAGNSYFLFSHRQAQVAAATFDQRLGIGLTPGAAGELASGIFFRAVGIGNWEAVCRNGGAETAVDTGIAQAVAWRKLLIDIGITGVVRFNIDGVLVATITTNLPAAGVIMTVFAKCDTTGAAANESFGLDYIFCRSDGLNR